MRFTIERIRMLVVAAAVVLLAALGVFLAAAKWKNRLGRPDRPQRLAKEIQQQANEFNFVHAFGAHSQYKIHASEEVQLRDNRVLLHEVRIELYGEDGSLVDQIAGETFEYDVKSGLAIAEGPVEMVLTQPASAGRPNGSANHSGAGAPPKQIHVKTSGVTFDRDTGMVTTTQRVEFAMVQGEGSSIGAVYDSQKGDLTLDHAVELSTQRGADSVKIRAQHAEFDRGAQICLLRGAMAETRGEQVTAAQAAIFFREDGSAQRLEGTNGVTLATANGGRIQAPMATMDFDEHSEPQHGRLEGGVVMDSERQGESAEEGRAVHGTSPTADLEFAAQGKLRRAHLERGVEFTEEQGTSGQGDKGISEKGTGNRDKGSASEGGAGASALSISRTWRSPVADVDFRDAGKGEVELVSVHGTGGVMVTSESRRGDAAAASSKMSAGEATATFGANSALRSMTGAGHASMVETTATGALQTATGDRLQASFAQPAQSRDQGTTGTREQESREGVNDIESAELDGHVVLFEQPVAKSVGQAQPPLRATAGKAVYEGAGEWVHLTESPRVTNGGLEISADKVDVSRQSGDGFAHGNVKATWSGATPGRQPESASSAVQGPPSFGGNGPAHVIAADAEMNQSTGQATFRGRARLWQQANSISAPEIVLNQHLRTVAARTDNAAEPVRAVLLNAGGPPGTVSGASSGGAGGTQRAGKPAAAASTIRVRGGDLWYSDAERRATMHGGVLGAVAAETASGTSSSDQLDLRLMPAGENDGQAQVDRMTEAGHVVLSSQGRRGTGEKLEYSSLTGDYTLTGTAAAPPRMTDPVQGSVTGEALIFHTRDDSVSIEGGRRETVTQTTAPETRAR